MVKKNISGFTLIELLIVVAIIAILAAIAIPNFLAAQTRAKVSKQKAGMATAVTALESYQIDNTAYPPCRIWGGAMGKWHYEFPIECTTPIAYITSRPTDIFERYESSPDILPIRYTKPGWGYNNGFSVSNIYAYYPKNFDNPDPGPAGTDQITNEGQAPIKYGVWSQGPNSLIWNTAVEKQPFFKTSWYDPTNGITSRGFVVKLAGGMTSP
jgi:prepilin-type N-terminal cleavage/methylation domain-containing protein